MTATSRKTARSALASLLSTALVGTGKPVQAVYAYPPALPITESPLIFIRSSGTRTKRAGVGQSKGYNRFKLEIVLYMAAANTDPGWTATAAADVFDDIEAGVRDVVLANAVNAAWTELIFVEDEMSEVYRLEASQAAGGTFDVEIIKVEIEVYDT